MACDRPEVYLSYLLRLWRTGSEGHEVWRASLEEPLTGHRTPFTDADALFTFLRRQMALRTEKSEPEGGGSERSTE